MDQSKLIDEILARVAAKLAAEEAPDCAPDPADEPSAEKPGLLVLCQTEDPCCSQLADSLKEHFAVTRVCGQEGAEVSARSCVVLCQLTNDVLSKLALGICDTPYTRLASQAILMGKRVYIPTEQVELYRYATMAPAPYYAMLKAHLDLLTASGAVICSQSNLAGALAGGGDSCPQPEPEPEQQPEPAPAPAPEPAPAPSCGKELKLEKRVLTEKDVLDAAAARVTCIRLPAKCILTALAKDCAKDHGIRLELG